LKGAGLLEGRLPPGFGVPVPRDDSALSEDEDPLEGPFEEGAVLDGDGSAGPGAAADEIKEFP
jgi:segregation and condensation protein B